MLSGCKHYTAWTNMGAVPAFESSGMDYQSNRDTDNWEVDVVRSAMMEK